MITQEDQSPPPRRLRTIDNAYATLYPTCERRETHDETRISPAHHRSTHTYTPRRNANAQGNASGSVACEIPHNNSHASVKICYNYHNWQFLAAQLVACCFRAPFGSLVGVLDVVQRFGDDAVEEALLVDRAAFLGH